MKNILGLALLLAIFWLVNSGMFKTLLLVFGAVSVIIVVAVSRQMTRRDGEEFPLILPSAQLPGYLIWMLGQIVRSNLDVASRVWRGRASISPVVIRVKASQTSDVGKVLYANSITMTPGTVTLRVDDDVLEVHALTREGAAELEKGEMDRRVTALGA